MNEAVKPGNTVSENDLSRPGMFGSVQQNKYVAGPLIAGVWQAGASSATALILAGGAIADEITSTAVPNSPLYKEIDENKLSRDNTSLFGLWSNTQHYRARAEEILTLLPQVAWDGGTEHMLIRRQAAFWGNFHAGYAWMLLGDYFGVSPQDPSVYVNRQLVAREETYKKARQYWEAALLLGDVTQQKMTQAMLAKLGIHTQQFQQARQAVENALTGVESFSFTYAVGPALNPLFATLGKDARDAAVDPAFKAALTTEAARKRNQLEKSPKGHWYLATYKERDPVIIVDDAEVKLIRAELIVRHVMDGDATALANEVIRTYDTSGASGFAPGTVLTITDIIALRRVYLSWRGERYIDLRRMNIDGDIQPGFTKLTWKWIGITDVEK
ncbi:hypothetical protein CK934_26830 [Chitinophaga sp. MD30]|nr:hypothetical protein CK934_26830 [Chitinophaga sp. MD30]